MPKANGVDLLLQAANKQSDTAEQIGDLAQFLRLMWAELSPGQRLAFMATAEVRDMVEGNLPNIDYDEAFEQLVGTQLKALRPAARASNRNSRFDAFSELVVNFPGLLTDDDVDGGDVVDWLNQNLNRFR